MGKYTQKNNEEHVLGELSGISFISFELFELLQSKCNVTTQQTLFEDSFRRKILSRLSLETLQTAFSSFYHLNIY